MRVFGLIIQREHPRERALRRWGQLSPELRELVARASRSVAKDAVQDLIEAQGQPFHNIHFPPCRQHSDLCSPDCRYGCHDASHEHFTVLRNAARPSSEDQ